VFEESPEWDREIVGWRVRAFQVKPPRGEGNNGVRLVVDHFDLKSDRTSHAPKQLPIPTLVFYDEGAMAGGPPLPRKHPTPVLCIET